MPMVYSTFERIKEAPVKIWKNNMALTPGLPRIVEFSIDNQLITIRAFDNNEAEQSLGKKIVNIIASGPSIADLTFTELRHAPTIFVNGSISLTEQYYFTDIVGYVISDANFINHNPEILRKHYSGQPLYATLAVFEALAATQPDIIRTYYDAMRVLYPVDRPWGVKANQFLFRKLTFKRTILNKNKALAYFSTDPNFVIDGSHKPMAIGVSLNITCGFVEAGTVAYVATQLAFSRHASIINLYGIDLLNSHQPRFYESDHNSMPSKLAQVMTDRIVPSFNLLIHVYKQHGVAVINHSPISKALFNGLD